MSFSASTCLTNLGTTPLGSTLNIYSNPESPTNPGTYVTNVPTDDITGGNCPYTFEVPDGTTTIRLSDPTSGCYCDIPVSDNNMCTTCDLNFNTITSPSIGLIVAGDITGTCDASVSNYLINWYNVTDPLNPIYKFSSGKGTMFQPYDYIHPLTGTSSVLTTSGYYEATLEKIELNGVVFSRDGEPGTILADLDCLPSLINDNPIDIVALNCNNGGGSSDLPQYEHRFSYSATTGGELPIGLSTIFKLSANTNYFVWKFKGYDVPDKLKLTLSGSAYPTPITLEYWEVGSNLSGNNYNINSFPKSADTSSFLSKATCLTGLTINTNDNIIIEITPSTENTQTSWAFYCGCLDTFDCDICDLPSGSTISGTTSYQLPIIESSITGVTGSCDTLTVQFRTNGISPSCFTASSINDYFNLNYYNATVNQLNTTSPLYLSGLSCGTSTSYCASPVCTNNGDTIRYEKSPGLFRVYSNSTTTINTYFSDYNTCIIPKISPFSGDNTNINYYRYFKLNIPNSTGTTLCGDGTVSKPYFFHQSSSVSTGFTGTEYYFELTMPTITSGITYTSCDIGCSSTMNAAVTGINAYSTGTTYNYTGTTTVGATYDHPFEYMNIQNSSNNPNTAYTLYQLINISDSQNFTVPATGETPYTIVPSLSGITCPNLLDNFYDSGSGRFTKYIYRYTVKLFDPLDFKNFRIYSTRINHSGEIVFPYTETLVYEWSGGTVTYSNPEYLV